MSTNIRNFVIVAHVDHGKSTLADRLLEATHTVEPRNMQPQYLDQLELERERGITIKMAPVRMVYHPQFSSSNFQFSERANGESGTSLEIENSDSERSYVLNLIDTPGHADFSYEVSRALAAVEGAVLLVDATQGVQAQTLAVLESARRQKLALIGAVNKVDTADETQIENAIGEVATLLGCEAHAVLRVSGKTGQGVLELLGRVISDVPAPRSRLPDESRCSRALIFDSLYDDHKGIIAFVRVVEGTYATGARLRLMATNTLLAAKEVGYFAPKLTRAASLETGEIGYIATGMKDPDALRIGDTVTADANGACVPLPGYAEPKPVVFVSLYPEDTARYENLKSALSQLRLTDASLAFEPEANEVLGRGFKGGFLGQLHFEITVSRLEREFGLATITSFPSVAYRIVNQEGTWETITNPRDFPEDGREVEEPVAATEILVPNRYLGAVLQLKEKFRFSGITVATLGSDKSNVSAHLPLADLVSDLNDRLKSISEGFASLSYEVTGWQSADVVKMDTLVAGQVVPGLTRIVPRADAGREARATVEKLKKLLPQQQFTQAIQAVVAGQVIARETIAAARKDVTGYLYGGDRSRKMKLWKKQQRGKKRLKERGEQQRVKVPVSVFKELLKR